MNVPTCISLLRGAFALLLVVNDPLLRVSAVLLAAVSDFFDGFLARRWGQESRLGTLIDPLMDKIFAVTALAIFFVEGGLTLWQIGLFLLRDISLIFFTLLLWWTGSYSKWQIRSFWCGKIMTTLQFAAFFFLALGWTVPPLLYWGMGFFGLATFIELVWLSSSPTRD